MNPNSQSDMLPARAFNTCTADPLIMGNGRDMLEMVCNSYESPSEGEGGGSDGEGGGDDDEDGHEQFDFSECTCMGKPCFELFARVSHHACMPCPTLLSPCLHLHSHPCAWHKTPPPQTLQVAFAAPRCA